MGDHSPLPSKRPRLSITELTELSKEDIVKRYLKQQDYVDQLETKLNASGDDVDDKEKAQSSEASRRENVLVMRLATKEQEVQNYAAQISLMKKTQDDAAILSLRQANLDPGVNLLFGKMREELQQTKDKLEQAQSELSAWKFTPDSQNGKKLMSRCRTLIAENQELGKQLSQGKSAQLEAELALQKKYSEELKASGEELNEFVIQLDEEVEGMQSTIQVLQQQLADAKAEVENYRRIIDDYEDRIRHHEAASTYAKEANYAKTESIENDDDEAAMYSGEECMGSPRSSTDMDKGIHPRAAARETGSSRRNVDSRTRGYESSPERSDNDLSRSSFHGGGSPEIDRHETNRSVNVNSPGTPIGDPDDVASPGTPTEENMEYDTAYGSWDRHDNAWSGRTSPHVDHAQYPTNGSPSYVENDRIGSPSYDEPDIKATITSVNDNAEASPADSEHIDRTSGVTAKRSANYCDEFDVEKHQDTTKPVVKREKSSNHTPNARRSSGQTNNEGKHPRDQKIIPASDVSGQKRIKTEMYEKLAQSLVMPDDKSVSPSALATLQLKAANGSQLQSKTDLTRKQVKSERSNKPSSNINVITNHSIPAQNGIEETADERLD